MDFEVPPAAPTPPAQGLTPEDEEDDPIANWGDFGTAKSKKKKDSKVEDPKVAKKAAKDKAEEVIEDKKSAKEKKHQRKQQSHSGVA